MSNIILLLGIGSSGKSTVAKELLKQLEEPYQLVGFDYAVMDLDKKYWPGGECEQDGFHVVNVTIEHGETPELRSGPIGKAFLKKMIDDMIALANRGVNLIIDMVPSDAEYKHLQDSLAEHRVLRVGLKPPLEKVIEREDKRPDRRSGTAKAAYHQFYDNKTFDLVIDTDKTTAAESGQLIAESISDKKRLSP